MCITLVEDNTACFTWEDLEYFKKHRNAFTFDRKDIENLTNKLTNGEVVPRIKNLKVGRFFHIKNDGIVVGELWIDWCDATEDEISIRIFDEYQKKGYATQAILYYLEHQRRKGG